MKQQVTVEIPEAMEVVGEGMLVETSRSGGILTFQVNLRRKEPFTVTVLRDLRTYIQNRGNYATIEPGSYLWDQINAAIADYEREAKS